jgi:hypothetical protein
MPGQGNKSQEETQERKDGKERVCRVQHDNSWTSGGNRGSKFNLLKAILISRIKFVNGTMNEGVQIGLCNQ